MESDGARHGKAPASDRQAIREQAERGEAKAERDRQAIREEGARGRRAIMLEINRCRGEVAKKLGTVVEDCVAPSIRRLARDVLGCGDQESSAIRTYRYPDSDRAREFDALYVGTRAALLNETKTTALPEYCREFVEFLRNDDSVRYFSVLAGEADRAGVLVAEHPGERSDVLDQTWRLRGGDRRRSDADDQSGSVTEPARSVVPRPQKVTGATATQ